MAKDRYRSGFERRIAEQAREAGLKIEYEPKDEVLEWVPKTHKYQPDWRLPNGILVETKGRFTASDRSKLLRVKEQHPDKDLRIVFMYDNTLTRGSSTRYSQWAEKHGFKWALRAIPLTWWKE